MFCKKIGRNFLENFAKFFHNKIYRYFLQKKFKTKLAGNMGFFSSDTCTGAHFSSQKGCWRRKANTLKQGFILPRVEESRWVWSA